MGETLVVRFGAGAHRPIKRVMTSSKRTRLACRRGSRKTRLCDLQDTAGRDGNTD